MAEQNNAQVKFFYYFVDKYFMDIYKIWNFLDKND